MNRELKFRAWHKEKKCFMDEWYPMGSSDGIIMTLDSVTYDTYEYDISDNNIIQQFTGMKDRNGKEIFEGDIFKDVLASDNVGVVKFGEYKDVFERKIEQNTSEHGGHHGFFVHFDHQAIRSDLKYWANHSEIIGNIYENQELLPDEEKSKE